MTFNNDLRGTTAFKSKMDLKDNSTQIPHFRGGEMSPKEMMGYSRTLRLQHGNQETFN